MLGSIPVVQKGRWLWSRLVLVLSLLLTLGFWWGPAQAFDDFLDPEEAFQLAVAMHSPTEIDVHFTIAPEYYMYQSRFAFALNESEDAVDDPHYPPAQIIYDPTFEKDMAVYREQVTVRVPLRADQGLPGLPIKFSVSYQGCADAGLCYSPMTETVQLRATQDGYQAQGRWVVDKVPEPLDHIVAPAVTESVGFSDAFSLSDTGLAGYLSQATWVEMMALAFVLGLLLSFTPCVLPMVPILLSIIAGQEGKATDSRWRGLSLAAVYVLGMSLVYTALGVVAGLAGASLAAWLQTPWVLSLFAVILALLALSMFGVYNLQVPTGMQSSLQGRLSNIPGGRYSGVFLMGMLSALIVGPCVAAPLAGVLLFISQTGDVVLGGATLFALDCRRVFRSITAQSRRVDEWRQIRIWYFVVGDGVVDGEFGPAYLGTDVRLGGVGHVVGRFVRRLPSFRCDDRRTSAPFKRHRAVNSGMGCGFNRWCGLRQSQRHPTLSRAWTGLYV